MLNYEVQLQDSPLPYCCSIVSFLTARILTTHITYFSTARSFERVHGWTIFNLSVSDHPPVAGPLASHSPSQWHRQASRIWYRAGPEEPCDLFPTKTKHLWRSCCWLPHKDSVGNKCHSSSINYLPFGGREFYVENIHSVLFPWLGKKKLLLKLCCTQRGCSEARTRKSNKINREMFVMFDGVHFESTNIKISDYAWREEGSSCLEMNLQTVFIHDKHIYPWLRVK